jgi:phosphoribosylformimino-5-aminoimidazole carboxamide ribotide isomerase
MILLPAIDILDGKAVRLARGSFDDQTIYDADPLDAARRWAAGGARGLHVVDLDGARSGAPVNLEHVRRIVREVEIPVQAGGGLRTVAAVHEAVHAGATRVVLGTAAYRDIDFIDAVVAEFGDRVVVSVDARRGRLAGAAWIEQTDIPVESVIERMTARGVRRFVYSSIERDGMLAGPDLEGATQVVNLSGVIVGKALYEGRFTVQDAQQILDGGE